LREGGAKHYQVGIFNDSAKVGGSLIHNPEFFTLLNAGGAPHIAFHPLAKAPLLQGKAQRAT
jgi:hypothetical protein